MSKPYDGRPVRGARASVRDVLVDATRRLRDADVPSPSVDAAELLASVLGVPRSRLLLHDEMSTGDKVRFEGMLARRMARIPLQHILGVAPFRMLELQVGPGVFIPRPETELVVEAALRFLGEHLPADGLPRLAVDLCTGSGAIAVSLATEAPLLEVHAIESEAAALHWAERNIEANAATAARHSSSLTLHHGDAMTAALFGGSLASLVGRVDVVVTNPPYVPDGAVVRDPEVRDHDPKRALYGGLDGLDVVRGVVLTAGMLLRRGGLLVVEHGDLQGERADHTGVPDLLRADGNADVPVGPDIPDREPSGPPAAQHWNFEQGRRSAPPTAVGLWESVEDHTDLAGRPRFTTALRR